MDESLLLEDEPEKRLHYVEMQEAHNNGEVWNCRFAALTALEDDIFRWTGSDMQLAFDINPSAGTYTVWVNTRFDGEPDRIAATSGTYGVGISSENPVVQQEFKFFEPPNSRYFEQYLHNMRFPEGREYLIVDVDYFHFGCWPVEYSMAVVEDVLISEI